MTADTKTCERCGEIVTRPRGLSRAKWEQRTTCGHRCEPRPVKTCHRCGSTFERPTRLGDKQWEARRFCARTCDQGTVPCEVCHSPIQRRGTHTPRTCCPTCTATLGNRTRGRGTMQVTHEDTETVTRLRSEKLPADSPRRRWIERHNGKAHLCCGHCLRRFPRDTIRQAERLRDLHARYCKPRPAPKVTRPHPMRPWTTEEDAVVQANTVSDAMRILNRTRQSVA